MYKLCISKWSNSIPKFWCNTTQNTWAIKQELLNKNSAPKTNLLSATLVFLPFSLDSLRSNPFVIQLNADLNWIVRSQSTLQAKWKGNALLSSVVTSMLSILSIFLQYIPILSIYILYLFVLSEYWEYKAQNWTENELGFLLYEPKHQHICGFL